MKFPTRLEPSAILFISALLIGSSPLALGQTAGGATGGGMDMTTGGMDNSGGGAAAGGGTAAGGGGMDMTTGGMDNSGGGAAAGGGTAAGGNGMDMTTGGMGNSDSGATAGGVTDGAAGGGFVDKNIDPATGAVYADPAGASADQLGGAVGDLKAEDLGALDNSVLGSLNKNQLGGLDAAAVGGLSSEQIGNLAPGAVAGLTGSQLGNLSSSAVAGFTDSQVAGLDATAVGGFKADQVASLDASALGGFKANQVASLDATAMGGFKADQVAALDPTAMAGLKADQVAGMDATAMAGFDAAKVSSLNSTAMSGLGAAQLSSMPSTAMAGFEAAQVTGMTAAAMTGLGGAQLAKMNPAAMAGFESDQIKNISVEAIRNLDSDKMASLTKEALGGISADQFDALDAAALGGLKSENLGGLGADVFSAMSEDDLANLDATEVKEMAGEDFSKLVTNLNEFSVTPDTVAALLPEGWNIDSDGDLTAPPGAGLAFATLEKAAPTDGEATIAPLPDLSTNLSLGGGSGDNSVLGGMDNALAAANVSGLGFTQRADGILNVGTADGSAPAAAFIPDVTKMVQAPEGSPAGLSVDEKTGGYVVITDQGYQIPLLPSIANPTEVANLLPDSEIEVGAGGQISINNVPSEDGATSSKIAGIASPILETSEQDAGTYRSGTGADATVKIVYEDGTAQTLKPAINDQTAFESAASALGVEDLVFKVDGSVSLTLGGANINLKPLFDIEAGAEGTKVTPSILSEDGRYFVISSNGDRQEFVAGP